ncbi:MAG: riboflavin kinase, partial [Acidimicrobiales bacterium]
VRGVVVRGDGRGRQLGYPTANLATAAGVALPAVGIYAGWFGWAAGRRAPAAVSIGYRPTFPSDTPPLVLEAHLLDFDGDLYGEGAGVGFVARLRDEVAFAGVDALLDQMADDVAVTRAVLTVP